MRRCVDALLPVILPLVVMLGSSDVVSVSVCRLNDRKQNTHATADFFCSMMLTPVVAFLEQPTTRRFEANNIYTNVADVLVSINPYADIPGLYDIPMPVSQSRTTSGDGSISTGSIA